jgi:hypothetical protein
VSYNNPHRKKHLQKWFLIIFQADNIGANAQEETLVPGNIHDFTDQAAGYCNVKF